jgi:hypothetical protein
MKTYIVTFAVGNTTRLEKMESHLKSYGYFCPIHNNCWAVKVDKTAAEIRNELMKLQETEDRIFVVRSGTEAAWNATYGDKNVKWLKEHL